MILYKKQRYRLPGVDDIPPNILYKKADGTSVTVTANKMPSWLGIKKWFYDKNGIFDEQGFINYIRGIDNVIGKGPVNQQGYRQVYLPSSLIGDMYRLQNKYNKAGADAYLQSIGPDNEALLNQKIKEVYADPSLPLEEKRKLVADWALNNIGDKYVDKSNLMTGLLPDEAAKWNMYNRIMKDYSDAAEKANYVLTFTNTAGKYDPNDTKFGIRNYLKYAPIGEAEKIQLSDDGISLLKKAVK